MKIPSKVINLLDKLLDVEYAIAEVDEAEEHG